MCGRACGWCPRDSSIPAAGKAPSKWKPMERVISADLSYEVFVEKFKKTSTPVVIEGWLDGHPEFKAWNLTRLVNECGNQPVHCIQRRVAALQMIIDLVDPSLSRGICGCGSARASSRSWKGPSRKSTSRNSCTPCTPHVPPPGAGRVFRHATHALRLQRRVRGHGERLSRARALPRVRAGHCAAALEHARALCKPPLLHVV